MVLGIPHYVIATRFIVTMGHLTSLLLLFSTIENNVNLSFEDRASDADKSSAYQSCIGALCFGIFCFVFDFMGMFMGTTLFSPSVNMFQILMHFIGSLCLSWLIVDNWNYLALWPIVITCNIPTALVEIAYILGIYVFRIAVY